MTTYCNDASFCFCLHCIYIEKFEDTKGAIRIRISKKNRQHNGQKKVQKDKQRSTKHAYKTKIEKHEPH